MPELAEVETMRRGLESFKDQTLVHIKWWNSGISKGSVSNLNNCRLEWVNRLGKNLVLHFFGRDTATAFDMIISPRMTGAVRLVTDMERRLPHDHAYLVFEDGVVAYSDIRRFGYIKIVHNWAEDTALMNTAFDLTWDVCDFEYVIANAKRVKAGLNIKKFLMDYRNIAGIGNYMASEILYGSNILPMRTVNSLTVLDWERLLSYGKSFAQLMISLKGARLKDYVAFDGTPPQGQTMFRVYGQQNCPVGHPITKTYLDNRVTFYCSQCQV